MAERSVGRFRLLALDVDGTLLDSAGSLSPRTRRAVQHAVGRGVQPVLCTGRRYRRALPIGAMLGLNLPLVCNSGALVKDPATHRTLWRADLEPEILAAVLDQFRSAGHPVVSFTDHDPVAGHDLVVERYPIGQVGFDEYVSLNHEYAGFDPDWIERARSGQDRPHFHVCAIGERPAMLELETRLHRALDGQIRTFVQKSPRYIGWMCEVLHRDASKWSALMHLAEQWGVPPAAICAVGDDLNDVPMLQGAGLGVAMGHAPPEVQAAADRVIGDHHAEGLAEFLEQWLADQA